MTRITLAALAVLFGSALVFAQEGQDPPKQPPQDKGAGGQHETHVRAFPEVWKEMEPKLKEIKALKGTIVLQVSDPVADATEVYKGEFILTRPEKQIGKLFWNVGTERMENEKLKVEPVQKCLHDGNTVTVTDERDPKDLRFWKDTWSNDIKYLPQDLLLTNGKDLDKNFIVKPISDPKMAKAERTISKHLDDRLETKDPADPTNPKPANENRVDYYVWELTPKDRSLANQVHRIMLVMEAVTFQVMQVRMNFKDGSSTLMMVLKSEKVDPKDVPDTTFQLDLTNYKEGE